jgi:hypothetical protein
MLSPRSAAKLTDVQLKGIGINTSSDGDVLISDSQHWTLGGG